MHIPYRLLRFFAHAGIGLLLATASAGAATTWHVSAGAEATKADGRSPASAFASIQAAVDKAGPDDTVLVGPGIYFETVVLQRGGTAKAPIKIVADRVERDRVIISGADRAIREKRVRWELVDASLGLYSVPFKHRPTRVLAGRVDLVPYQAMKDLRAFRFVDDDYPAHPHGFFFDKEEGRLYVRLRADGKYGPTNPNDAMMCVSPVTGGGSFGNSINRDENFNLGLRFRGPAHVIIDGFTFETPGLTGVFSDADDVLVRNSWFYGCRIGVAGRSFGADYAHTTNRVTVENCFYTQYPAFADIEDAIRDHADEQLAKKNAGDWWQRLMHWQRKAVHQPKTDGVGRTVSYETGLVSAMGEGWVVRRNHLHDVFEGISSGGVYNSKGAKIYENRFERVCDNAIEAEDHARDLHIYRNLVIDAFEPFSWQPMSGAPLPGPVYIYDNIVWQTPEVGDLWVKADYSPAAFKFGANDNNWRDGKMGDEPKTASKAPGGVWVAHNTVYARISNAFVRVQPSDRKYDGFYFFNNVMAAQRLSPNPRLTPADGIVFLNNVVANTRPELGGKDPFAGPTAIFAGEGGKVLADWRELGFQVGDAAGFRLAAKSPAKGVGLTKRQLRLGDGRQVRVPDVVPMRRAAGAEGFDFLVGPQPRK